MSDNKSEIRTVTVPIEAWMSLAQTGVMPTAMIRPIGTSMWPIIRSGRDTIEVRPLAGTAKPGDVVVFKRADGQAVVHRVYKVTEDTIQTWGDNCAAPDAPVPYDAVFGIVTKVHRGHLTLNPYVTPPVINSFRKMLQSVKRIKRKICT